MSFFDSLLDDDKEERSPLISGVMIGVVTNNQDPDNLGRVKLKLPLQEGDTETDWVRIATLMAGADRGSLFVPEVGDEVLVAFHLGDMSKPFVIGALWSAKNKPPQGNDDKNNVRQIVSRSGHTLLFNDDAQGALVSIKTKKGHLLKLDDQGDAVTLQESGGEVSVKIEGGASGQMTIAAGSSKITITKQGQVTISGAQSLNIKAPQISIKADATLDISAGASLNIKSDGVANIKGSLLKLN